MLLAGAAPSEERVEFPVSEFESYASEDEYFDAVSDGDAGGEARRRERDCSPLAPLSCGLGGESASIYQSLSSGCLLLCDRCRDELAFARGINEERSQNSSLVVCDGRGTGNMNEARAAA